jgi:hypothetical protein
VIVHHHSLRKDRELDTGRAGVDHQYRIVHQKIPDSGLTITMLPF